MPAEPQPDRPRRLPRSREVRRSRKLALAALAVLLWPLAGVVAPAAVPAAQAAADSQVSGATTYTIDPAARAVHAQVKLSVRNTKPDSFSTSGAIRYYFNAWGIAVQDEASHVRATRNGAAAHVAIRQRTGYKLVEVSISPAIFYGATANLAIAYDLPDGGARSSSQVRVGAAFATFVAYAFGDDQATVKVVVPAGYVVTTSGDPIRSESDATGTLLVTDGSVDDQSWYAVVTAENDAALRLQTLSLAIGGQDRVIEVRAWPEDERWSTTVADELARGYPDLARLIGLPWPLSRPLEVREAYTPLLGGYAGFYIQGQAGALDEIRITEEPDGFVILHEASHAWFNGDLFSDRWIGEGLADQYASLAQVDIGGDATAPDAFERSSPVAFPLEDWPPPGYDTRAGAADREHYGYSVAWLLVRSIYTEVGPQAMRAVLAAAATDQTAYVGRDKAETRSPSIKPDWRYFLDLLEQRGGSASAAGLFMTWVVSAADQPVLARHEQLRSAYAALVERGAGWLPGLAIRSPLAGWDLSLASGQIDEAGRVLDLRARIAPLESALVLTDGGALQAGYESAANSYDEPVALATEELATLGRLQAADAAVGAVRGPLAVVGLWGSDPAAGLAAAEQAYRSAHLAAAGQDADAVAALIAAAQGAGTARLALGGGLAGILLLAGGGLVFIGRRRPVGAAMVTGAEGAPSEPPATLGAPMAAEVAMLPPSSAAGEGDEDREADPGP
ncbi:MAG: hypothetical protein ACHQ15_00325 [Candidatus Limnocylindrales bacterium]